MNLSRYAARLSSAQESAPASDLIMQGQEAPGAIPPPPGKFGPASVAFSALPAEPEDALLTGGTRSLTRRLLALNLTGSAARPGRYKNDNAA
ncbi:MAG TPA: hypothetical protein VNW54_12585 [Granulicella sp.]|jgi:hypothetical protein|nr:hypothetical protein [Granulicella sp.]